MKRLTKSLFFEQKPNKRKNAGRNSQVKVRKKFMAIKPFKQEQKELQVTVDAGSLLRRADRQAQQYVQFFKGVRSITSNKGEIGHICEWLNLIFNKQMRNITKELFGQFRLKLFRDEKKKLRILNELQAFKTNVISFIPTVIGEFFFEFMDECQSLGTSASTSSSVRRSRTPLKRKASPFARKKPSKAATEADRTRSTKLARSQKYDMSKKMVGRIAHSKSSEINKSDNIFKDSKEKSFRYLELNNSECLNARQAPGNRFDSFKGQFQKINLSPIKMKSSSQDSQIVTSMNEFNFETMNETFSKEPKPAGEPPRPKRAKKKFKPVFKKQSKLHFQFKKKFGLPSSLRTPFQKKPISTFRKLGKKAKPVKKRLSKVGDPKKQDLYMVNLNIFNHNQQGSEAGKSSEERFVQPRKMDDFLQNMNNLGLKVVPLDPDSVTFDGEHRPSRDDPARGTERDFFNADIYGSSTYQMDKYHFLQKQALYGKKEGESEPRNKGEKELKRDELRPQKSNTRNLRNLAEKNRKIMDSIKFPNFGNSSSTFGFGNRKN